MSDVNLDNARALLTTRYGPLPGYAWVAIAAGGTYVVVRRRRRAQSSQPGDNSSSEPTTSTPADAAGLDNSGGYANDYIPPGAPSAPPPVANPTSSRPAPRPSRPGGPLGATGHAWFVYTVRRGDTIGAIARRFHTTAVKISRANPTIAKTRTGRISVGEVLVIPR